jgi:hypothetical protein
MDGRMDGEATTNTSSREAGREDEEMGRAQVLNRQAKGQLK